VGFEAARRKELGIRIASPALGLLAAACGIFIPPRGCGAQTRMESLSLPPGFSIALYADGVAGARSLALGARGTVFVDTRTWGRSTR
jgi:hypothetical protein